MQEVMLHDVLIVRTAIQSSKTVNTVVVTDLLILLLHHADMDVKELYFRLPDSRVETPRPREVGRVG